MVIKHNELINKKHKQTYKTLNFIKQLFILISAISGCVSISAFASVVGIPAEITSSAVGLKICTKTKAIKKYKSVTNY